MVTGTARMRVSRGGQYGWAVGGEERRAIRNPRAGNWEALLDPLRSSWALEQVLSAFRGKAHLPGLSLTFHPKKSQGLKEANARGRAQSCP